MSANFAFISCGQLTVGAEDGSLRSIDSKFAGEVQARVEAGRRRHGWKAGGEDGLIPRRTLWGRTAAEGPPSRVEFTAVARGEPGEILYALRIDEVGGLFRYRLAEGEEVRLLHRTDFLAGELARNSEGGCLAYSQVTEAGAANLVVRRTDEASGREVTEGDSLDQAPAWVEGQRARLVFQSAGIARDRRGFPVMQEPFRIEELDLDTGSLTTLLEDADRDLLLPHRSADGSLLFLQRPYENPARVSYGRSLVDFLLLPLRLLRALFHFLNFFSMAFSGKPLTAAGGAQGAPVDLKRMVLWGRVIDVEQEMRRARGEKHPHLVPDSWQLIRRAPDQAEQVLARGVVSFDVGRDGGILYTDGAAVFRIDPAGRSERLCEHFPIEKLFALA